jgi:ER-bound oxygenase mpaB/B'/Rubber oxygenase, catalytic domain
MTASTQRHAPMRPFIAHHSVVRRIWGDPDIVLLIFAGAAAEFALNRAVDWLFFTNRLPKDPIGRLFSTVHYAQRIVFANEQDALATLTKISAIHSAVERGRGQLIPDWAYRDVLYLLIDNSRRAYELLHGPLSSREKDDLYSGFLRVGLGLQVKQLPTTFEEWEADRDAHLKRDLVYSEYTKMLFEQYRRQLGWWRYQLLLELQGMLVPEHVRELLQLAPKPLFMRPLVTAYSLVAQLGLQGPVQHALIPKTYWPQIKSLTPATREHAAS